MTLLKLIQSISGPLFKDITTSLSLELVKVGSDAVMFNG